MMEERDNIRKQVPVEILAMMEERDNLRKQVPVDIMDMMEECDNLHKQDHDLPRLSTMNDEITKATSDHKRRQRRELVESIDNRQIAPSCSGQSKELTSHPSRRKKMGVSPSEEIPTPHHFKAGKALFIEEESSGVEGCKADVSRGSGIVHRRPGHQAIKSVRNSRAYGPDSLSIFHLENLGLLATDHLGPLATEHLKTLYNDSH